MTHIVELQNTLTADIIILVLKVSFRHTVFNLHVVRFIISAHIETNNPSQKLSMHKNMRVYRMVWFGSTIVGISCLNLMKWLSKHPLKCHQGVCNSVSSAVPFLETPCPSGQHFLN